MAISQAVENLVHRLYLTYRDIVIDLVFMEVLLVRFEKPQRAFIRKAARRNKSSEAEMVRKGVSLLMRYEAEQKRKLATPTS